MAIRRCLVSVFVAAVFVSLVAPVAAFPARAAPQYYRCSGNVTYTGTVFDEGGNRLWGVVVYLYTTYPYSGPTGTATTNSNGAWSITIGAGDCPYNAKFYWRSKSNGPLMLVATSIPQPSSYTVPVWQQLVALDMIHEFPNDPTVEIAFTISTTVTVSVAASISGNVQTGFLGVNAAGKVGTDSTFALSFTSDHYAPPYHIFYPTATVFKVQDVSGNTLVYALGYSDVWGQTAADSEYLSMYGAIDRDHAAGSYPYVQVAPNGHDTTTRSLSQTTTLDQELGVTVFGVTLTLDTSVSAGTTQSVSITLWNSSSSNACFAIYNQGMVVHAWLYGYVTCPPS